MVDINFLEAQSLKFRSGKVGTTFVKNEA